MIRARFSRLLITCALSLVASGNAVTQEPPPSPASARILLVPWRMVSGERATLAVLDVHGRLTPNVNVAFSNGDKIRTDKTGRALYVAPLNAGVLFASISGRPGRVKTTVVPPEESAAAGVEVASAPRTASLRDRFTLIGGGFCGDADKNEVTIGGKSALVLASSPLALQVLPPMDLDPGPARVDLSCGKQSLGSFTVDFLSLELDADSSHLAPGQKRSMVVRVTGTAERVSLEARNLSTDVVQLTEGNPAKLLSSGGTENVAKFEIVGRNKGKILISIRLVPQYTRPRS